MPLRPFHRLPVRFMLPVLLSLHSGCAASPELQDSSAPTGLDYLIVNGQPDYKNRYSSVVQVLPGHGTCSGVLVTHQLVLTAAHCFCSSAQLPPGRTYRPAYSRASSTLNEVNLICAKRAEVIGVLYSPNNEDQGPSLRIESRQGSARLHEEYEFRTDAAGQLVASRMDLAAIHLDKPFKKIFPDTKLAAREVQPEETLFVVGYGDAPSAQLSIRHSGKNQVMDIAISVGGEGLFSFRGSGADNQGAHAWRGDSGGPCFREDAAGNRWLAGIISTGKITPQGMLTYFTSVFHHRAWIKAQMDLSEKQSAHQKDASR